MDLNRASRYLSYLLRHHPEAAGITLDAHGWADVDQLLAGMKKHRITRAQLEEIVAADQKQRYAFDERRTKIRANQGHSIAVDVELRGLGELPPVTVYEPEYVKRPPQIDTSSPVEITVEDGVYIVEGPWLQRLISNVNFGDYESRMWFDKMLREAGVFALLEERGIQDGDLVSMYNLEFEYQH